MDKLFSFDAVPSQKGRHGHTSYCTIVYSKNGSRLVFAKKIVDMLGLTDSVKIAHNREGLWIGKDLPDIEESFGLKDLKPGKKAVYSIALVKEVIERFDIDFKGKVSCSFYGIKLERYKDYDVACLNIEEGDTDG